MKNILILLSLLISLMGVANAQTSKVALDGDFVEINYVTKEGDSFSRILRSFLKDNAIINAHSPTVQKTLKSNSQIKDKTVWQRPPVGTRINLYVEKQFLDTEKFAQYKARQVQQISNARPQAKSNPNEPIKKWNSSLFYMASRGSFDQSSDQYPTVNFQQNSYLSLGLNLAFTPNQSLWNYSSSFYFSKLNATGSNLDDSKVSIPNEFGFTLYAERLIPNYSLMLYGGLDYDTFSTFNLPAIATESKIYVDKNNIYYVTLGLAKKVEIFNKDFLFKASVSKSVISNLSSSKGDNQKELSGQKAMLYLNTSITNNFYVHAIAKVHLMSSDFDLTTTRFGLGFGYIFF